MIRLLSALSLLALTACGAGNSLVVPLPQKCERMERVEIPAFGEDDAREYRVSRTVNVAEHFPELSERVSVGAWLSRVQVSALDGADLSFVEEVAVAIVAQDGREIVGAQFNAETTPAETIHLAPTGADFLSYVHDDGTATVVVRFKGTPPDEALNVAVTACFSGEAEYALGSN